MKIKSAGLPRWAWVSLFSGAVLVGLYLRHRSQETEEPEEGEEEPSYSEDSLASYEGTDAAGGLAAAGLIGPAQGQVLPVEAPYIPQGFVDIFESQGETIGALAEREPGERVEDTTEVIHERDPAESSQGLTGGGPTRKKPHHKAPPKHRQKKQKKPRQKKPPKKHPPKKHKAGSRR
jgi:hypothetical protein